MADPLEVSWPGHDGEAIMQRVIGHHDQYVEFHRGQFADQAVIASKRNLEMKWSFAVIQLRGVAAFFFPVAYTVGMTAAGLLWLRTDRKPG
jgi:hypothetical protein